MHDPSAPPLYLRFRDRDVGYFDGESLAELEAAARTHCSRDVDDYDYLWGDVHSALIHALEWNAASTDPRKKGKDKRSGELKPTRLGDGVMQYAGLIDINPMASVIFAFLKCRAEIQMGRRVSRLEAELAMLKGPA